MLGMQIPISVQYDEYLLISLETPITRKHFLMIQSKLQQNIGGFGNVCATSNYVPYPDTITYLGTRVALQDLEDQLG